MYVAANGFYLADGRGGRSFFVAHSCQADYREQSMGWFGTTAIIVAVGRNDGRLGRNRRCQGREGEVL